MTLKFEFKVGIWLEIESTPTIILGFAFEASLSIRLIHQYSYII